MQRVCSSPCWRRRSPLTGTLFLRRSRRYKPPIRPRPTPAPPENTEKKNADVAPAQKKNSSKKPTASTASTSPATAPKDAPGSTAPASDPPMAGQKALSVSTSRMVWVNTESGKPGTRWYGKTKQGKYMTEADAIKAGYHPAKKE